MTPIQACKETRDLWTEMARIAGEEKRIVDKVDIPGPCQMYKHDCPCCEYAWPDCCLCPMLPEWRFYSGVSICPCEGINSPYERWRLAHLWRRKILCIDVEFFCLLIAEMAEEAEMRHIAESQPRMVEDKDIEYV